MIKIRDLEIKLKAYEIQFGGIIRNVPRKKISPFDERSKKELSWGGVGGDRMSCNGYGKYYARFLYKYLGKKNIVITEVGILTGIGLAIWSELFKTDKVYGFDIDTEYYKNNLNSLKTLGAFKKGEPKVFEFDQFVNNNRLLKKIFNKQKINICIDDGHHSSKANLSTFKQLLPYLDDNFTYFIEDNPEVYKILKEQYPQFRTESFGRLTVITNPQYEINEYLKNKKKRKTSIAIYTAFTKNYDNLIHHHYISKDIDYICFTNTKISNPGVWEIRKMHKTGLDNNRKAKEYKVLPHKFLKKYKYSLWIDTNIDVLSDTLEKNIKKLIQNKEKIALQPHFKRNCIYEEATECISLNKDNPETILKQISILKKDNYPANNGLSENGLIFREHNNLRVIKLMTSWWKMIINNSYRDQLSLYYVFWKNKFKPKAKLINKNFRFMETDFSFVNHNKIITFALYPIKKLLKYNNVIHKIIAIGDNKEYKASISLKNHKNINNIKLSLLKGYFCSLSIQNIQINSKSVPIDKVLYSTNGTFIDHNTINFLQTSSPEIFIKSKKNIHKVSIFGYMHIYNTETLYLNTLSTINEMLSSKAFKLQRVYHKLLKKQN